VRPFPRFLHGGDRHVERHRFPDAREVPGEYVGGAEALALRRRVSVVAVTVSSPGRPNVEAVGELFLQRLFEDRNGGAHRVVGSAGTISAERGRGPGVPRGGRGKAQKGRKEKERGRPRAGVIGAGRRSFLNSGVPATFIIWKTAVSVLTTTTPASRSAAMPLW